MPTSARESILALLAKEWTHSGPPGIMDISDIVAVLSQAPSETLAAVKELFADGMVDMDTLKTAAFLTPEGFAAAENAGGGKD
jgi:Mn-dependent DtxR family transcriptional regulator